MKIITALRLSVGLDMIKTTAFINEKQWHVINAKYRPICTQESRDGRDRFRHWKKIKNGCVIFNITEYMWAEKEYEWLFVGDESVLAEMVSNAPHNQAAVSRSG